MASANVGDCLSGAWGIFKNNAITHVVCTLLVMVVASISAGLLAGPMMVGYMRMIERETRGEAVQIGDVFGVLTTLCPRLWPGSSARWWCRWASCCVSSLACWSWRCPRWRCSSWRAASAMVWPPSTRPGAS